VLRIQMARGAGFAAEHDRRAAPLPVAVISDALWQRRFDGDPRIGGRLIRLDDVTFTIVGVAARGFRGTSSDPKDVWLPISSIPLLRDGHIFDDEKRAAVLAGRLADGVSREQARAELELLSRRFRSERGLSIDGVRLVDTSFFPNPAKREAIYPAFGILMTAVLLVLGLACANVGNLLLARAAARRHETAVRLSLGAGRGRLIRQLLTESLILAAAATAIGIGIAWFLPGYVLGFVRAFNFPMTPDYTVFAYTAGLMLVTCLAFGLVPACHASREAVSGALKSRSDLVGGRFSIRGLLLTAQVAITVVLLLNAGLLVRGVQRLSSEDPGIVMDGVSVVSFKLPASYEIARTRAFAGQLVAAAAGLPEAARVGFTGAAPFAQTGRTWVTFSLPDAPATEDDALVIEASPGYFDVLDVRIVAGRNLTSADSGRPVVLINETIAGRLWPRAGAVGRTVVVAGTSRQVAGVVRNTRTYYGNIHEVFPTVYEPIGNRVIPQLLVRHLDEASKNAVAAFATRLEPRASVAVMPLADLRDRLVSRSMFGAQMAGGLAALALMLASVGLFSVFAYVVQQRTREIGIRMALGARSAHVVRTIAGESSRALIVGLLVGGAGAVLGSRLIRSQLHGVSSFDPAAYLGVAAVLTVAGLLATYVPARRAARVDPTLALRCE
jgi:putative ABC transport system permease protein